MKHVYSLLLLCAVVFNLHAQTLLTQFPVANASITAIAKIGNVVYVGGDFSIIGGVARNRIAAIDATTGAVLPWDPNPNGAVRALLADGNTLFVGGAFTNISGTARTWLAAFDATTGNLSSWNANLSGGQQVLSLVKSSNTLFIGGSFLSVGAVTTSNFGAVDINTGAALPYSLSMNGWVYSLATDGTTVFLGGGFDHINTLARNRIASVDIATGSLTSWNPNITHSFNPMGGYYVLDLVYVNGLVYAGGFFTHVGGISRGNLAAIDPVTGLPNSWAPNPNTLVWSLFLNGNQLYVGGGFVLFQGQPHGKIAIVDLATGNANAWNPNITGNSSTDVQALYTDGNLLFAGGDFHFANGTPRDYLAVYQLSVAAPLPVNYLSFNARPKQFAGAWQVDLDWSTASEQNSEKYVIERSKDGRNYVEIGTTDAAGNSNNITNYSFTDRDVKTGTIYYRLKQVDLDGKFNYSKIAIANINRSELIAIVYPNPATDILNLLINSPSKIQAGYSVIDVSGRTIKTGKYNLQKGDNSFTLQVNDLPVGKYNLIISNSNSKQLVQFAKQ